MMEAYTDRARRVLVRSMQEARAAGETRISNEHILLAILREIDAAPLHVEGRCVHEHECLAGVILQADNVDRDRFEQTLRGGAPRPDVSGLGGDGTSVSHSRGANRALRSQLLSRRIRHGLALDTAAQLVASVSCSIGARRAARAAGLDGSVLVARLSVDAVASQRAGLDAQAREIFTPAEIATWAA